MDGDWGCGAKGNSAAWSPFKISPTVKPRKNKQIREEKQSKVINGQTWNEIV